MVDQQLSRFLQSRSLLRMLSPLIPRHVKGFQHSKWNKAYDNDRSNPERMRASHDAPTLNDVILNVKIGNKASPKLISATFTVYLPYCLYCHLFCKTENPFGITYNIYRTGDESWKLCKYLVSFINTEEDIKHRAELALDTYRVIKQFLIASI